MLAERRAGPPSRVDQHGTVRQANGLLPRTSSAAATASSSTATATTKDAPSIPPHNNPRLARPPKDRQPLHHQINNKPAVDRASLPPSRDGEGQIRSEAPSLHSRPNSRLPASALAGQDPQTDPQMAAHPQSVALKHASRQARALDRPNQTTPASTFNSDTQSEAADNSSRATGGDRNKAVSTPARPNSARPGISQVHNPTVTPKNLGAQGLRKLDPVRDRHLPFAGSAHASNPSTTPSTGAAVPASKGGAQEADAAQKRAAGVVDTDRAPRQPRRTSRSSSRATSPEPHGPNQDNSKAKGDHRRRLPEPLSKADAQERFCFVRPFDGVYFETGLLHHKTLKCSICHPHGGPGEGYAYEERVLHYSQCHALFCKQCGPVSDLKEIAKGFTPAEMHAHILSAHGQEVKVTDLAEIVKDSMGRQREAEKERVKEQQQKRAEVIRGAAQHRREEYAGATRARLQQSHTAADPLIPADYNLSSVPRPLAP